MKITIKRAVAMSEDKARVEGAWTLIKILATEPFNTCEFKDELTFK